MKNATNVSAKVTNMKESLMKVVTSKHLIVIDFYELAKEHSLTVTELEDLMFEVKMASKKAFTHCHEELSGHCIKFFSRELASLYFSLNKVQECALNLHYASPDTAKRLMNSISEEERSAVNRIVDMIEDYTA